MTSVAVRVENLTKIYGGPGGTRALDDVSLTIADSEFVSIIGPSGCGKSTLLRILAGLAPFDRGSAQVFDAAVVRPRDDVGVVFQTANLLPWLTVRENLTLALEVRRGKAAVKSADWAGMIELLNLSGFADSYPHELSGGMKHRVAIGQALMLSPRLLLMDEPFGALDALTRDKLNLELLRLWQNDRKTVALITHSISEAVLLSDRVLVLSDRPGRLIADLRIDLPRPRDPVAIRGSDTFRRHVAELNRLMGVV